MMGGLMVHTAEVIAQSEQIADFWENKYGPNFINKPLLLSAALLHDVAKTKELDVDRASGTTSYSTRAALETHITMCVSMIDIAAYKLQLGYQVYSINELNENEPTKTEEQLKFEQEAVSLLKHCVLAHHGKLEYGSCITMNCPEAYILNTADLLSSEMFRYNKNFNEMDSGTSNAVWLGGNMVNTYKDSTK
jgi:3'-5' exoribonuclease